MENRKEWEFDAKAGKGQKSSHRHSGEAAISMTKDLPEDVRKCMLECLNCATVCRDTMTHCLETGGEHAKPEHIFMLLDCAEFCETNAHILMHNSPVHHITCEACGQICEQCAEDCERMEDQEMRECVDACRRCVETCRKMAEA